MIRRWIVSWLSQPLLDLIRDEIDLYLADVEAALVSEQADASQQRAHSRGN